MDTSVLLLAARVTPANTSDGRGAWELPTGLAPPMPRLEKVWANAAYAGKKLRAWCEERTGWQLQVVPCGTGSSTFEVLPRRRVVESSFAWIVRNRRLTKDYERKVQTGEGLMKVATVRLMPKRLANPA